MTLPFSLPDWLPWWVPVALLVPGLLYSLVFLLMPFSVFGLKGRLEAIEARLDEIQGEIRTLALRLPEGRGGSGWIDPPPPIAPARSDDDRPVRPPIPPAPVQPPRRAAPEANFRPPPPATDRPAPEPGRRVRQAGRAAEPEPPPEDFEQDAEAEEDAGPRRRPVLRPARPSRTEPRLDWPR